MIVVVAFLGELTFGVLNGVLVGVLMALVLLIGQTGRPPTSVLGRTPSGTWHDVSGDPEAVSIEGMVLWRQEAPLVFLNARRLAGQLVDLVQEEWRSSSEGHFAR